ncbi:hypothetical protein FACS189440_19370 [Bacteroidia bacterium]|nr:hypothetical protein FACS189423_07130 [Bacteroidia bacterium]GHT50991.1 hypothetical protein FACS189440_19370 [Bacteroidia bacterium]
MNILFHRTFEKDYQILPEPIKRAVVRFIDEVKKANTLREIKDCKKLEGVENGYRVRCGDYRVLFLLIVKDNTVYIRRVLPRGQAYKKHN